MPSVCVQDCGLAVVNGRLGVDWAVVGMKRVCVVADGYRDRGSNRPSWVLLREVTASWTNETCRSHRVIARMDVPWVQIRVGPGNGWYVRGHLDGRINDEPPQNPDRAPDMQWCANWWNGLPVGTDQEQQAPGSTEAEFVVPGGSTIYAAARMYYQVSSYIARPSNSLGIEAYRLSLSAWPQYPTGGSGRTCA